MLLHLVPCSLSAVMADPRKTQVRALRRLAAHCNDVQPVRDDSGKERVEQFAKQLSKSKFLSAPQKQEVATALEAYLATFSGPPAGQEVVSSTGFRLRGRSFLLTYNWDFLAKPFPDGTPCAGTQQSGLMQSRRAASSRHAEMHRASARAHSEFYATTSPFSKRRRPGASTRRSESRSGTLRRGHQS